MESLREYETLFILRPDLTDEATLQINERLKGVLDREGARLLKCNVWGKRKTAFEVKKQPKGIYVQLCFLSAPGSIREVERNLRMLEPVIRYQTIKVAEEVDVEKRLAQQEAEDRAQAEAEAKARAEAEARQAAGLPLVEPEPAPAPVVDEGDEDGYSHRRGRPRRGDDDTYGKDEE
jgi:small subunit ribosomal protein S6